MKVTVIGYWGAYPEAAGATSAYLIEKDGFTCLMDCGSGALSRLQLYRHITDLDMVILSHYHHDHIADIGVLQYSWLVQNILQDSEKVLPVYGHTEDKAAFQALTHRYTVGIAYEPGQELEAGPFHFSFLKTDHPVPCYGMRITDGEQVMVYTADTRFKEEWMPFAAGSDLLITDCSFYAGQDAGPAGHMTSQEGAEIARQAGVKELWLSHLPHFGEHKQLVTEAVNIYQGPVRLAREGLNWGE